MGSPSPPDRNRTPKAVNLATNVLWEVRGLTESRISEIARSDRSTRWISDERLALRVERPHIEVLDAI